MLVTQRGASCKKKKKANGKNARSHKSKDNAYQQVTEPVSTQVSKCIFHKEQECKSDSCNDSSYHFAANRSLGPYRTRAFHINLLSHRSSEMVISMAVEL